MLKAKSHARTHKHTHIYRELLLLAYGTYLVPPPSSARMRTPRLGTGSMNPMSAKASMAFSLRAASRLTLSRRRQGISLSYIRKSHKGM